MGKKRKKEKQQKFIAKITRDGKVNKKEAQKAAKKGISLAQIERATIRSFRDEQRSYQRTPTERRSSTAPAYSPLLISRGATNVFSRPKTAAPAAPAPPQPAADPAPEQEPESGYSQEADDVLSEADTRFEDLMNQFKIAQQAAEERNRLAMEAQRRQMLTMQRRERAAGRTPNLQFSGAGQLPQTAGTQGFRRRKDQFKITPFKGIGGMAGFATQIAKGAANKMVNI